MSKLKNTLVHFAKGYQVVDQENFVGEYELQTARAKELKKSAKGGRKEKELGAFCVDGKRLKSPRKETDPHLYLRFTTPFRLCLEQSYRLSARPEPWVLLPFFFLFGVYTSLGAFGYETGLLLASHHTIKPEPRVF